MEEIAEACEVSPRTFFRYFPTKEDVLFADAAVRRERLLAVIAERPPGEPAFAALCAAMRTLTADYRDDRDALVARSKIVAASPHLQVYKAEHQHGWEVEVVDVLQRRALAQHEPVTREELVLVTAVTTAALRVALDAWVADASAPDLGVMLDDAFAAPGRGIRSHRGDVMGKLEGRVAIVTGGARGQGAAEAALFADEGATVFVTDVLVEAGEKTAAEIGGTFVEQDVADPAQWDALVARVVADHGRLDILVNNAGILRWERMADTSVESWNEVVAVNQTGVFLGMRAVAPQMKEQRSGSIVNISSVGGLSGASACFAYAATKWAVRGMTKGAAIELGPHGIKVNSIHPGIIDTPMMGGTDLDKLADVIGVPLQRYAQPEEVAKLALWLVSDDNSYSTGAEFVIDGGQTA